MTTGTAELWVYQLSARRLEHALPALLERTLAKSWRAVVRCSTQERAEDLARHLWSYRDDSFLPHGTAADGHAEAQPIYLTTQADRPNGAHILFLVDGASAPRTEHAPYERVALIFDGTNRDALSSARAAWKEAVADGAAAVYWEEGPEGWVQKAKKAAADAAKNAPENPPSSE